MKNPKGFILITLLVFVCLISMLAYQSMESALIEKKLAHMLGIKKTLFEQAQANLRLAEKKDFRNYCPDPNKGKCLRYEHSGGLDYKIISKMSQSGISVIVQLTCEAYKTKKQCKKILSWTQMEIS
jgi:Tfp pilus assembly protein PilX